MIMAIFSDLNIEQSIVEYLADKFTQDGYSVYYWDTKQLVGDASEQVTFIRNIPEDPAYIVGPSAPQQDHTVRTPFLTVYCSQSPRATQRDRMGIGEKIFDRRADVRIECFASNELEWYTITSLFVDWLNDPDVEIEIRDYQEDLKDVPSDPYTEVIRLEETLLRKVETDSKLVPVAARYLIQFSATARCIE
jgi:hypothetical protein